MRIRKIHVVLRRPFGECALGNRLRAFKLRSEIEEPTLLAAMQFTAGTWDMFRWDRIPAPAPPAIRAARARTFPTCGGVRARMIGGRAVPPEGRLAVVRFFFFLVFSASR